MCGLWGAVGNIRNIGYIEQLAIMSMLRGTDSAGMAIAYKKKEAQHKIKFAMHKDICDSFSFLQDTRTKVLLEQDPILGIIGHCRAATIGDVTLENAHPYSDGPYLGVHNGTIDQFKVKDSPESDSRNLFRSLREHGEEATLTKADEGAYALVYFHTGRRSLTIVRNDKRFLYTMDSVGKTVTYWASERGMLELLKDRCGLGVFDMPTLVPAYKIVTISLDENKIELQDAPKKKVESVVIYRNEHYGRHIPNHHHHACGWKSEWEQKLGEHDGEEDESRTQGKGKKRGVLERNARVPHATPDSALIPWIHNTNPLVYRYWNNHWADFHRAVYLLNKGCAVCGCILPLQDTAHWFSQDDYLCDSCKDTDFAVEYCDLKHIFPSLYKEKAE